MQQVSRQETNLYPQQHKHALWFIMYFLHFRIDPRTKITTIYSCFSTDSVLEKPQHFGHESENHQSLSRVINVKYLRYYSCWCVLTVYLFCSLCRTCYDQILKFSGTMTSPGHEKCIRSYVRTKLSGVCCM